MGNKSGKQKVTNPKKNKHEEPPNENLKTDEKPENGPTTTTEKVEEKPTDATASENQGEKGGAEGDGGGGGSEETPAVVKSEEPEKTDTETNDVEKDKPESDKTETEKTEDTSAPPTDTEPSDSTVKESVDTPPTDGAEAPVVHSDDIEKDTPVTNGDTSKDEMVPNDEPSTEKVVVDSDLSEITKEEVQNGEPVNDVQIEVTPPVPDEVAINGTETEGTPAKDDTTDPEPEKQDDAQEIAEQPSGDSTDVPMETKYSAEFKWEEGGDSVLVSGTFNEWKENIPLEKNEEIFTAKIELPAGEYLYKYLVDDQWLINKNQPIKTDNEGKENNVLVLESAG